MSLLIWGLTISTFGKVLLGVAVVRVHLHVAKEHKIDRDVIGVIKRERLISIIAIAAMIIGYVFEVAFYQTTGIV